MSSSSANACVVMPAYCEAGTVGDVVTAVRAASGLPVIVVSDASTDGTASESRGAGACVLELCSQLGAWGAVQAGIRFAMAEGYRCVVTMDADGQHPPDHVLRLIDALTHSRANVVIGSCPERGSRLRQLAWGMMRASSGLRIEDLTSGFRAYDADAMALVASRKATYLDFQDVGVLALLQKHGLEVADIEVPMQPRTRGSSKIFSSWLVVGMYMCHTLLLGISKRPLRRGSNGK